MPLRFLSLTRGWSLHFLISALSTAWSPSLECQCVGEKKQEGEGAARHSVGGAEEVF